MSWFRRQFGSNVRLLIVAMLGSSHLILKSAKRVGMPGKLVHSRLFFRNPMNAYRLSDRLGKNFNEDLFQRYFVVYSSIKKQLIPICLIIRDGRRVERLSAACFVMYCF